MNGLGILIIWLFSLLFLYLVIWFGVRNGVKDAIKELDIRLETLDGHTVISVKDREMSEEPEDEEILE